MSRSSHSHPITNKPKSAPWIILLATGGILAMLILEPWLPTLQNNTTDDTAHAQTMNTIIYLSGETSDNPWIGSFKISSEGENLFIYDQQARQIDHVSVPHLSPNTSYAR